MTRKIIVVTGANGFVGKNLCLRLRETRDFEPLALTRESDAAVWREALARADAVIHLAGVNRPSNDAEFMTGNRDTTLRIIAGLAEAGSVAPIIYASSTKAREPSPYGASKKSAEDALLDFSARSGNPVHIFRLPNVFGKWSRPNYNSAVATFCHNIARGLPIVVNDPAAPLQLVYVDDVIDCFLETLRLPPPSSGFCDAQPVYDTRVGDVAAQIARFSDDRRQHEIARVGTGLTRALYSTYVASLPRDAVSYPLTAHADARGAFSEILKTPDCGQFSFFTALPGVTRGGHYHHSKTEKFVVVQGEALFRFRHMISDEKFELRASASTPTVVETVPGWAHDVTNIGDDVMICLLWANEAFDRARPDTVAAEL